MTKIAKFSGFTIALFLGLFAICKGSHNLNSAKDEIFFTENVGQILDPDRKPLNDVLFFGESGGAKYAITTNGISYVFSKQEEDKETWSAAMIHMRVVGANPNAMVKTFDKTDFVTNYYLPQFPNGKTGVLSYKRVELQNILPGIDLIFTSKEGSLKYNFRCHAGSDPSAIKIEYKLDGNISLDERGNLHLSNILGSLNEASPVTFRGNGEKIKTRFKLDNHFLSFELEGYQTGEEIMIDPEIIWGTYYGTSTGNEQGKSVTTDTDGNIFIAGETNATNFPVIDAGGGCYFQTGLAGSFDAFLVKFNSNYQRLWATYYGGTTQEADEKVKVSPQGTIYLGGSTSSLDFPVFDPGGAGYYQDINFGFGFEMFFVAFDTNGVRKWSTYFGNFYDDRLSDMETDANGNLFFVGRTDSLYITGINPGGGAYYDDVYAGDEEMIIGKFSSSYVQQWTTFYGESAWDEAKDIEIDASGNVFITGFTECTNFPTLDPGNGAYFKPVSGGGVSDAFLLEFNNNGVRQWSTFIGGNAEDQGNALVVDHDDELWLGGYTKSTDFPIQHAGVSGHYFDSTYSSNNDCFLMKFSNTGSQLWGTYYGAAGNDMVNSISIDTLDNLYVVGNTTSSTFSRYNPGGTAYFQNTYGGLGDGFFLEFSDGCQRKWATFFGGSGLDEMFSTKGDELGKIFTLGSTDSQNLTVVNPGGAAYYDSTYSSGTPFDMILYCIESDPCVYLLPDFSLSDDSVCNGDTLFITNLVAVGTNWTWKIDQDTVSTDSAGFYFVPSLGANYTIQCIIGDSTCSDSLAKVFYSGPIVQVQQTGTIDPCPGDTTAISTDTYVSYVWIPGGGTTQTLDVTTAGYYSVSVTDAQGCSGVSDSFYVYFLPGPGPSFTFTQNQNIFDFTSAGFNLQQYTWDFGDGLTDTVANPTHTYVNTGDYLVCLTATDLWGCTDSVCDSVHILAIGISDPNLLNRFVVFPNPNEGIFKIRFEKPLKDYNVQMFNAEGVEVRNAFLLDKSEKECSVRADFLPVGVYFIMITGENGVITGKIVVEK